MLEQLAFIDIITLDAAVASNISEERAARLLANRQYITPHRLPKLLITAHNSEEYEQALVAAEHLQHFVDSVSVITESSRNKTAVNALALHRANWPETSEQERKSRILLLSRRGGGGKPQFIVPFLWYKKFKGFEEHEGSYVSCRSYRYLRMLGFHESLSTFALLST